MNQTPPLPLQSLVAKWADQALPANANTETALLEELLELRAAPNSPSQIANVCLALMLHADRQGVDVLTVARDRLAILRSYEYGHYDENGLSRHVEPEGSGDGPLDRVRTALDKLAHANKPKSVMRQIAREALDEVDDMFGVRS